MYLRSYGHNTFQQDDDPAVSFALHLQEYTHYSIEFTSVDAYPTRLSCAWITRPRALASRMYR